MKNMRTILFRVGAVVILLVVAAVMMVIGRGHTVYIDNKNLDYNGQTYVAPYKLVVFVDGEQAAKLYNKAREDRGMATCIGQTFTMTLEITQEKGGAEETKTVTLPLPYGMDGIAINVPALLAGLPEEAYLSEFQVALPEESAPVESLMPGDEFGMDILGDI